MEQVRRGYVPEDEAFFYREDSLEKLCQAQRDLLYLIERGYPMKNASVFTGNHYLLSERQAWRWSGQPPPARQSPYAGSGKSLVLFRERKRT